MIPALPCCLEIAGPAPVRGFDPGSAGSWISLVCVCVCPLAALAAPDSRQLEEVPGVQRVLEGWEDFE